MKITIATGPIYPVPAVLGGSVQRLWHSLANEFAAKGHDVTIFAKAHRGQPEEERLDGVRIVRWGGYDLSTSLKRDLLLCLLYAVQAAPRVPVADIVVTNDFWMPAVLPRLRPSAGKVVVNANRFPKKQYALYGRASAFSAASAAVADAIIKQVPRFSGRVRVIPNCIDDAFLKPLSARTRAVDSDEPVHILYVGRINPEKGLNLLAEALRHLSQSCARTWRCSLVGPVAEDQGGGGHEYAARIMELMDGMPVTMLPPVYAPAELSKVYESADIFVYPSQADTGEAMPLAPIEAMARGAVPVVSKLGAFLEYVHPGVNGLVFDHHCGDASMNLAAELKVLIESPQRRQQMSALARAGADDFSPASIAMKHLNLFEDVLNGKMALGSALRQK